MRIRVWVHIHTNASNLSFQRNKYLNVTAEHFAVETSFQ